MLKELFRYLTHLCVAIGLAFVPWVEAVASPPANPSPGREVTIPDPTVSPEGASSRPANPALNELKGPPEKKRQSRRRTYCIDQQGKHLGEGQFSPQDCNYIGIE